MKIAANNSHIKFFIGFGMHEKKPVIEAAVNGPYVVQGTIRMRNSKGEWSEEKAAMALCRCGHAKPFCSGMHAKVGFDSDKEPDRIPDKVDDYAGENITIHDNRGVCAHSGFCTDKVSALEDGGRTLDNPDSSDPVEIEAVTKLCPSGALSYMKDGTFVKDHKREPLIKISGNGPYRVREAHSLLIGNLVQNLNPGSIIHSADVDPQRINHSAAECTIM